MSRVASGLRACRTHGAFESSDSFGGAKEASGRADISKHRPRSLEFVIIGCEFERYPPVHLECTCGKEMLKTNDACLYFLAANATAFFEIVKPSFSGLWCYTKAHTFKRSSPSFQNALSE